MKGAAKENLRIVGKSYPAGFETLLRAEERLFAKF